MAELLAEVEESAAARRRAKAEARERLRRAKERVLAKGRLYRVRGPVPPASAT
jgi:hypothetical protein